jgi:uncharacterized protein YecT (DUF1311 family)
MPRSAKPAEPPMSELPGTFFNLRIGRVPWTIHKLLMRTLTVLSFASLLLASPFAISQSEISDPEVKRTCQQYKSITLPDKDRPSAEEKRALAQCDSEALYYGFGQSPDLVKARKCAYIEAERASDETVLGGRALLMVIYANGKGADRNLDVAIKLACEVGFAPAEIEGRVQHLVKLKQQHWMGNDFSFCDDITSGYMQGFCADQQERFNAVKRDSKLQGIFAKWSPADRQAYAALRQTANEFFKSSSENEVDLSGTGRAAFQIQQQASLNDGFASSIQQFEQGKLPRFSPADFTKADASLNAVYQKIQQKKKDDEWGTVTAENIRKTQRVWIRYRDAWLAFGQRKYPTVSADSWKTWLTLERTKMLQSFQ